MRSAYEWAKIELLVLKQVTFTDTSQSDTQVILIQPELNSSLGVDAKKSSDLKWSWNDFHTAISYHLSTEGTELMVIPQLLKLSSFLMIIFTLMTVVLIM